MSLQVSPVPPSSVLKLQGNGYCSAAQARGEGLQRGRETSQRCKAGPQHPLQRLTTGCLSTKTRGHNEEGVKFLTCEAVWAPGSKILQSRSICCCWNSSSQLTTCTTLQRLPWPPACSRAQQRVPTLPRDRREHLESDCQAAPRGHSPCTAERRAAAQPGTAASPLSLKGGRTLRVGQRARLTQLGLPQAVCVSGSNQIERE